MSSMLPGPLVSPTRRRWGLPLAAVCLAGVLAALGVSIRLNLGSPSAPTGVWIRVHGPAELGDWVLACLPGPIAEFGRLRGFHPPGLPGWRCPDGSRSVLKRVEAVGGHRVTFSSDHARIEALATTVVPLLRRDRRGRGLPRLSHSEVRLRPGQIWLGSTRIPNSWDSRYYGPVPRTCVRSRMTRLVAF